MAISLPPLLDYNVCDSITEDDNPKSAPRFSHSVKIANLARGYLKGRPLSIHSAALLGPFKPSSSRDVSLSPCWIGSQPNDVQRLPPDVQTRAVQKFQFPALNLEEQDRCIAVNCRRRQKRRSIDRGNVYPLLHERALSTGNPENKSHASNFIPAKRRKYGLIGKQSNGKGGKQKQRVEFDTPVVTIQAPIPPSHAKRRPGEGNSAAAHAKDAVESHLLSTLTTYTSLAYKAGMKPEEHDRPGFNKEQHVKRQDPHEKRNPIDISNKTSSQEADNRGCKLDTCISNPLSTPTALTDAHRAFQKCLESPLAVPSHIHPLGTSEHRQARLLGLADSDLSLMPKTSVSNWAGDQPISTQELYNAAPDLGDYSSVLDAKDEDLKSQTQIRRLNDIGQGESVMSPKTAKNLELDSGREHVHDALTCSPQAALEPPSMEAVLDNADSFLGSWAKELVIGSTSQSPQIV